MRLVDGWRRWVAVWDHREDPRLLAAIRIAVAVVLLADFVTIWRLDLIEALWAAPPDGYAVAYDGWAPGWLGRGPDAALALWLAATVALVAIALGALTRVACVVFVLVSAQLGHLAPDADRAIDMMLRVVLVVLACSRSHARWSIDAWVARRLGRPPPREVPAWPRYLIALQLLWIYFSGGVNKAGAEWGPHGGFLALANILSDPHVARFDPAWVPALLPLTRAATALTMVFELTAPLYLVLVYYAATPERPGRVRRVCNRLRLRWVWLATGAAFHLGIAIGMRLGIFAWGMLALYPALLIAADLQRRKIAAPANRASSPS